MVKVVLIFVIFFSVYAENIFQKNCISCHKVEGPDLKKVFFDYLLIYSSEKKVKKAMFEYLKNPEKEKSVMDKGYIKEYGIKKKSKLNSKDLKEAINIYWKEYTVIGKLR